ncbi:MAG: PorT family protein [Mariniphaga sp.]|nr:PorT family protein [Mariniphaga sp.]
MYLWTNIQGKLNARRKERRIAILKMLSVAAAIVLAFLAGWWMTNPTGKDTFQQISVAEQRGVNSNITPSANVNTTTAEVRSVTSNQDTSGTSAIPPKVIRSSSSKLSSLASFAASTSILGNDNPSTVQKAGDVELFTSEKEFLDELHQNSRIVKKLSDWIADIRKDSIFHDKTDSKSVVVRPFSYTTSDKPVTFAQNNPVKNNGRWSIKAEFAPVFNNQAQNSGQGSSLMYANSQSYKPQETTTENTFSGGMVAGYKVSKRLIIKSGFAYNNIRQTTRNVDFMGVNLINNVAYNATLASTPAGQVNLDKMVNTRASAILNSDALFSNASKSSVENVLKQDIGFIEIPLQAMYKLIDKKIAIGLTGGISTNILVGNKAFLSENGENISTGETSNMRNVVYSGSVGFEVGYEITNRIMLTVEPRLKHFVNSISSNKSVNYKPSQMAIVTGLTYSFN